MVILILSSLSHPYQGELGDLVIREKTPDRELGGFKFHWCLVLFLSKTLSP